MLNLLESKKTCVKEYKKYGEIIYKYNRIIRNDVQIYDMKEIEELMDEITNLRGKDGFVLVFDSMKNIMLEKLRAIHFNLINSKNSQNLPNQVK